MSDQAPAYGVALIPGDGVGPEVIAVARKVVEATGVDIAWTEFDWGCDHFRRTGQMAPEGFLDEVSEFDAVLLGAVGYPDVPDHISLWGLLLPLRQRLDLWANHRPVKLLDGVATPLADARSSDIDILFIRENTEGEYSGVGGRAHEGRPEEVGLEVSVFTRSGVERVIRHGFDCARQRGGILTSATKSNASRYGYVLWDEVAAELAVEYDDVTYERMHVDALAARLVSAPASLDVVVASNLFGDILTDLGAAIQGGMGMAASASVRPGENGCAVFEPVHGSAPDIAGKGLANPSGAIWSAVLMLEHLGEREASQLLMGALEETCRQGPKTADIGGAAGTAAVGAAVVKHVAEGLRANEEQGGVR